MTVPSESSICGETFTDVSGHTWTCRSGPHGYSSIGQSNHYFIRDPETGDDHRQRVTKIEITRRLYEPTHVNIEFDGVSVARGYLNPTPAGWVVGWTAAIEYLERRIGDPVTVQQVIADMRTRLP